MAFPVDESRIRDAEAQLGRRLPDALRNRLLRDNGGEVRTSGAEWALHPVWDPSDRKRRARTASHIVRETAEARRWSGFPPDAIAVASDGGGNLLILRRGRAETERWDHETGACEPAPVDCG